MLPKSPVPAQQHAATVDSCPHLRLLAGTTCVMLFRTGVLQWCCYDFVWRERKCHLRNLESSHSHMAPTAGLRARTKISNEISISSTPPPHSTNSSEENPSLCTLIKILRTVTRSVLCRTNSEPGSSHLLLFCKMDWVPLHFLHGVTVRERPLKACHSLAGCRVTCRVTCSSDATDPSGSEPGPGVRRSESWLHTPQLHSSTSQLLISAKPGFLFPCNGDEVKANSIMRTRPRAGHRGHPCVLSLRISTSVSHQISVSDYSTFTLNNTLI